MENAISQPTAPIVQAPAPTPQPIRRVPPPSNINAPSIPTQSITPTYEGIPLDIMDYFGVDIRRMESKDKDQLRDIYNMIKSDSQEMGDVLLKISEIDRKLGAPRLYESRWAKMHSYLRIQSRIGDLEKQKLAFENGQ